MATAAKVKKDEQIAAEKKKNNSVPTHAQNKSKSKKDE